jgi:ABC-type transport system substrate-binding protein
MSPKLSVKNKKNEVIYEVLEDVEVAESRCQRTLRFREDFEWWDGTPVTAEDYMAQTDMGEWVLEGGPEETPGSRELVDEYTVVETFAQPRNDFNALDVDAGLTTKRGWAQEWLERFEGATTDEELNTAVQDLVDTKLSVMDYADRSLGCGLWRPVEMTDTELLFEKYENCPFADRTAVENLRLRIIASNQKIDELIKRNEFDGLQGGGGVSNTNNKPDEIENVASLTAGGGRAYYFNFDRGATQYRALRRALLYLLDLEELIAVTNQAVNGEIGSAVKYQGGMADPLLEVYAGKDWLESNLIDYGVGEERTDQARAVLQDNGFSMEGGEWVGPDGQLEPIEMIITSSKLMQTIQGYVSSKVEEFGLPVEPLALSQNKKQQRRRDSQEYNMLESWYISRHPSNAMNFWQGHSLIQDYPLSEVADVQELDSCTREVPPYELKRETNRRSGTPLVPEVPPPGDDSIEPGSDAETFNIVEAALELRYAGEERTRELARKIAWYANWDLPRLQTYYERWVTAGDTANFDWPDQGSFYYYVDRTHNHVNTGQIDGVPEDQ